jgi:hypothetical protein
MPELHESDNTDDSHGLREYRGHIYCRLYPAIQEWHNSKGLSGENQILQM